MVNSSWIVPVFVVFFIFSMDHLLELEFFYTVLEASPLEIPRTVAEVHAEINIVQKELDNHEVFKEDLLRRFRMQLTSAPTFNWEWRDINHKIELCENRIKSLFDEKGELQKNLTLKNGTNSGK